VRDVLLGCGRTRTVLFDRIYGPMSKGWAGADPAT